MRIVEIESAVLLRLFSLLCWRINSHARMLTEEVVEDSCASSVSLFSNL